MVKLFSCAFLTAFVVLGVASTVSADVAPPPDYVEDCTIENEQGTGETCISCNTYHGEPDACSDEWGSQGYEHRCNTAGASVWDEVWCKADETEGTGETPPSNGDEEETTDEVDETTDGCGEEDEDGLASASIVSNTAGAAVCAFFALGALIFIRRRR